MHTETGSGQRRKLYINNTAFLDEIKHKSEKETAFHHLNAFHYLLTCEKVK